MGETGRTLSKAGMGIHDGLPLRASAGGIEELRADIQRLMDMEAIRQLKHCYFRCIDTANLEELAKLLHDDVEVHFIGGGYEWKLSGRQEYLDNIGRAFNSQSVGHHNGHHPELQMHGDSEATGIWYLADSMWLLDRGSRTTGAAIYWDRYVKEAGRWLIRETRYERLYEINSQGQRPQLAAHYLGGHGRAAQS